MKLLVDQNISPRVVSAVEPRFPGSVHVRDLELAQAPDSQVWEFARTHGFAILSKDADFHQRSLVLGHPPKVIWIRRGNCATGEIIEVLDSYASQVSRFLSDVDASFLMLG